MAEICDILNIKKSKTYFLKYGIIDFEIGRSLSLSPVIGILFDIVPKLFRQCFKSQDPVRGAADSSLGSRSC